MTRFTRTAPALLLLALTTASDTSPAPAVQSGTFEDASLFLELNDTDKDLGIHASIDGESWTSLTIKAPGGAELLGLAARGPLHAQGLTQLSFESAEPSFRELAAAEFLKRFPEGAYLIEARAADGGTIRATARLSHVLAAPPSNIQLSGIRAAANCDVKDLPVVKPPVTIRWDPVTRSHPTLGAKGAVRITRYQVFVERAGVNLGVDLPPGVTELEVPRGVTALGNEFKFEIISRTDTGNNTAVESCFRVRSRP